MKKPADARRARPPHTTDYTKSFKKDWDKLSRTGRFDMHRLKEAMLLLIGNDEPLGPEWRDHPLAGDWEGHRECHIGGDFLLAYMFDEKTGQIVFVRAGTHADLFDE